MLIAVIGAVFVAGSLASRWPRDVDVTYEVGPEVTELDVDYLEGGQAVASVRFRAPEGGSPDFRHTVRLTPGQYRVHITLHGQDGWAFEEARMLDSPAASMVRFDLRDVGATE